MARRAWDETFLGDNRYGARQNVPKYPGINTGIASVFDLPVIREQSARSADPSLDAEIAQAVEGNDEALLPYQPTPTINPGRPRTLAMGYDERSLTLRIKFRNGEYYTYYNVPPSVWYRMQRASSPGRYINSTLNRYPYSRGLY